MAQGGHDATSSAIENDSHEHEEDVSTVVKLMSFGSPSMSSEAELKPEISQQIDLSRGRQYPDGRIPLVPRNPPSYRNIEREPHLELAERQLSFRTTQTECSNLESLTMPVESQQNCLITSITGSRPAHFNIVSSIENNEDTNIPVTTTGTVPVQISNDSDSVINNVASSSSRRNTTDSRSSSGTDSRASRSVNLRQPIRNCSLIHELPLPFIKFLSATFDRQDCRNWKDLVDLYNWNFKQITMFKNRSHPDGIFCSLLNENEFQQYNIQQLMEDLEAIPRRDALDDLQKMIAEHNSTL